jgi:hypothetical protein
MTTGRLPVPVRKLVLFILVRILHKVKTRTLHTCTVGTVRYAALGFLLNKIEGDTCTSRLIHSGSSEDDCILAASHGLNSNTSEYNHDRNLYTGRSTVYYITYVSVLILHSQLQLMRSLLNVHYLNTESHYCVVAHEIGEAATRSLSISMHEY